MSLNFSKTGKYEHKVQALVALLDEDHTAKVIDIWGILQQDCGLNGISATPFPHFSFHIAESYDLVELDIRLRDVCAAIPPFSVRTAGFSIFTGPEPTVYVSIVPSQTLLDVHQHLWQQTAPLGQQLNRYYRPGLWMPHITLSNKDVTGDNIGCVSSQLVYHDFNWEIPIRRVAVIWQEDDVADIEGIYDLQG